MTKTTLAEFKTRNRPLKAFRDTIPDGEVRMKQSKIVLR